MDITDGSIESIENSIECWIETQIKQAKEDAAIQLIQTEMNAKKELLKKITNVNPPSPKRRGKSVSLVKKTTGQQADSLKK